MELSVCSWNISRPTDFMGLHVRNKVYDWQQPSDLAPRQEALFQDVFKSLCEGPNPDIFCLQEVSSSEDIASYLGGSYTVNGGTGDCALAWRKERFSLVADSTWSSHSGRAHSVCLQDALSKRIVQVFSAHVTGFKLTQPTEADVARGNKELQEMLQQIDKRAHAYVVGMDANSTPEIGTSRLQVLSDQGFRRADDNSVTGYNPDVESKRVKIDYILAKGAEVTSLKDAPVLPLESPKENPSDHRPIFRSIKVKA